MARSSELCVGPLDPSGQMLVDPAFLRIIQNHSNQRSVLTLTFALMQDVWNVTGYSVNEVFGVSEDNGAREGGREGETGSPFI